MIRRNLLAVLAVAMTGAAFFLFGYLAADPFLGGGGDPGSWKDGLDAFLGKADADEGASGLDESC